MLFKLRDGSWRRYPVGHTLSHDDGCTLSCDLNDGRVLHARSTDLFRTLQELRTQLEALGIQIWCNGARVDVWSSGSQRDMGLGSVAYILGDPGNSRKYPVVDVLDDAHESDPVGTVEEQARWYDNWLEQFA